MYRSRGYQGELPEGMPRAQLTFEYFAESYGFTEDQTRSLSLDSLEWWPKIRAARLEAARQEDEQAKRTAPAGRRR